MDWLKLENTEALVRNARHNARFSAVRLPIIFVVSIFLWELSAPVVAVGWLAAMVIVERFASHARDRLINGAKHFAAIHLVTLAMMSALWVVFGFVLWLTDTELGRIAATIGLLTAALYGSLAGQRDFRVGLILSAPPLSVLSVLVAWHSWTHWPALQAGVSTLATLGACASVLISARALNRSDSNLHRANVQLGRAATDLQHSNALLRETSALAHVGGWCLNLNTQDIEWTAEMRCIFGVGDDFVPTPHNVLDFYAPESLKKIEHAISIAVKTGEGWDIDLRIRTPQGAEKWVRGSGRVEFVKGAPTRLLGAFADVTAQARLEQELRQAQRLESVGRMAGGVAHDFNNVLTAIITSAELIQTTDDDDVRKAKLVETILKASERATGLTQSLLAFSRQQPLSPKQTDLKEAISEVARLVTPMLPSDIALVIEGNGCGLRALLDPSQLSSALLNLIVNAKDAMPGGGTLTITLEREDRPGGALGLVTVRDTGAGIEPEALAHIFDPFFTTKAEDGGTGLGLSMVHGFITQTGGEISVESAPGAGTAFRLAFPLSPAEKDDTAERRIPGPDRAHSARVLLVDDDEFVRDALALSLRDKGYPVVVAADGQSALSSYGDGHNFDVVIADVVLTPAMSGPDLSQALLTRNPGVKTVLMSGYTRDKLTASGRLPPGMSFLRKPFSVDALIAHLGEQKVFAPQGDFGF